jgi:ferredoxin
MWSWDFDKDMIRIKSNEIPDTLVEKAKESMRDCAITAIHLKK